MTGLESLSAADAARLLSRATGHDYRLVGRLAGGETGAHELVGPDRQRVVVKWDLRPESQVQRRRAVGLTDRLREQAGWPVPRQRAIEAEGCLFVIQDLLPGAPVGGLTHALIDRLFELHEARVGIERRDDFSTWPDTLTQTLTIGGVGYCVHESLRSYDERTERWVARFEAIGRTLDRRAFVGGDIVHWDWHPGNLLELDGRLAAVIDNDFVTTGDAAFDLATLAVTSLTVPCEQGVRRRLLDAGVEALDRAKRDAYVGHLMLRFLDWSIRKGRGPETEFWLDCADRLLAE